MKKNKLTPFFILPIVFMFVLNSCKIREKMIYFNKESKDSTFTTSNLNFSPKLKIDDFISINISDADLETVALFNVQSNSTQQSSYISGNSATSGYLIDRNGEVNLPVIGRVNLVNLFREEAVLLIEEKLKIYLKNPVVQLQILNYKITVLGEVSSPGTFRIPNERITILEAIGLAGDLKISGLRRNILVVREENGLRKEYRVDLTSKKVFNSPVYYLHQNDVVYVEPNAAAITNSTFIKSNGALIISVTSLALSIFIILNR
jgi:polysaccharide export outer membrane protein